MLPLTVGVVPFGLVFGVIVAQSEVPAWAGGLASILIVAGASQIALIDLIDQGAPWTIAVGTALIINVRLAMYSAALAPAFRAFSPPWRWGLLHLITDQAAVVALMHFAREGDPARRRWFLAGAAGSFTAAWVLATWLGIAFGAGIPAGWQLGFAVPLTFLALLVPIVRGRPALVAAAVGGATALACAPLPFSLGVPLGALAGVAAGMLARP